MEFDRETCLSMSPLLHTSQDAMGIAPQSRGALDKTQPYNFQLSVSETVREVYCIFFISYPSTDILFKKKKNQKAELYIVCGGI